MRRAFCGMRPSSAGREPDWATARGPMRAGMANRRERGSPRRRRRPNCTRNRPRPWLPSSAVRSWTPGDPRPGTLSHGNATLEERPLRQGELIGITITAQVSEDDVRRLLGKGPTQDQMDSAAGLPMPAAETDTYVARWTS